MYNGSIRVRSSDTEPMTVDEVYIGYGDYYIARWVPYTDGYTAPWVTAHSDSSMATYATAVNRKNGNVAISFRRSYLNNHNSYVYIYNRSGSLLYSVIIGNPNWTYAFSVMMQFDGEGGIWGYGDFDNNDNDRHLIHFDETLSIDADISDSTNDFVYMLAAELDGTGVWYTHQIDKILYHLSWNGSVLHSIPLTDPVWVCGTLDNGCWVEERNANQLLRYDSSGNLVKTVNLSGTQDDDEVDAMCHDFNNGCWFRINNSIFHMTSGGNIDIGPVYITNPYRLEPSHNGVYVIRTATPDTIFFINNDGNIEKQRAINSASVPVFGAFSFNVSDSLEFQDTNNLLPVSYDPVWGTGGSLEWNEVRKDGYFLPKKKYHQVEVTLRGDAELDKIIMPPAIRVQDIQPDSYKNIYIKTNIPEDADVKNYTGNIRCWWGVID